MNAILIVMGGGAIGAALRHVTGAAMLRLFGPRLALGTLAVNIVGGLAMGLLVGWMAARTSGTGEATRLFLGVGVLGGFTTFSAFSLDCLLMLERGAWAQAAAYAGLSVAGSVAALAGGLYLARTAL